MTTEYRAELKALRKQARALGSERKTINRQCERTRKNIAKDTKRATNEIHANHWKAMKEVAREQARESKRLDRTAKDIAARIAVLEGRL